MPNFNLCPGRRSTSILSAMRHEIATSTGERNTCKLSSGDCFVSRQAMRQVYVVGVGRYTCLRGFDLYFFHR